MVGALLATAGVRAVLTGRVGAGGLKVGASCATVLAGFAGALMTGALLDAVQVCAGVAELRGLGAPTAKSAELLSVSLQPLPERSAAVVFVRVGVGAPSKQ